MTRPLLAFYLLLGLCVGVLAGPPVPLTLTLPNTDAYSYWVQSGSGSVTSLPVNVSGKSAVKIKTYKVGDRVVVLDAHTGQVASQEVAQGVGSGPAPLAFAMKDFRPLDVPAAPTAAPAPAPAKAREAAPEGGGIRRLLTGLISLALAGAVVWLLVHLVRTRGEPLLHLARRAGVEVPDPTPQGPDSVEATVIYTPVRRAPDKVPDEAGLPASAPSPRVQSPRLQRGPEFPMSDTPSLVGIQGLVAGGTFGLTGGDVTVGRDGENEIVLAENTVSRYHARISETGPSQYTLSDLESANGVYVNGTRVQRAILTHGDEIKIGDNYFRFQAAKESS